MSRSKTAYQRLLELIKRLAVQKDTLKALALFLGKGERYFTNLFSAKNDLPVTSVFEIADYLHIPTSWLMDKANPRRPPWPEDQLLLEIEGDRLPANPFLDDVARRLALLEKLPVQKRDDVYCNRPILESLEEERFMERRAALAKVEALVERLLSELVAAAKSGPLPARRLGELAATLGLWATIQRSFGNRDLAVKALVVAFPLVRRSGYAWAHGNCLQRASYVIFTLGRPDLACRLLDEAMWQYAEASAHLEISRLFADKGAFLAALPDCAAEAIHAYNQALERLPATEQRNRACVLQGLAYVSHASGDLDKALELLVEAAKICGGENYILGCVKWREGAVLFDLGRFVPAKETMKRALDLMGRFSSAGDIALVALDYAEALIRADHLAEADLLVADVTRWLPQLRQNPLLHRALSRFVDLARIGELNLAEVAVTRQTLSQQDTTSDTPLAIR